MGIALFVELEGEDVLILVDVLYVIRVYE